MRDVISETVDDRALLVDTAGMELLTLNVVGSIVWEALAQPRTESELVEFVLQRVDGVTPEQVRTDLRAFLKELNESGLIVEE